VGEMAYNGRNGNPSRQRQRTERSPPVGTGNATMSAITQASAHVVPARTTTTSRSSPLARVRRGVAGRGTALAGLINILLGTVFRDRHRAARGYRQRVIGMLQINCGVDHRMADMFVDRWMSKQAIQHSS